MTSYPLD